MTGDLITFPVRLSLRGARLLLTVAEDVTGKAVMGTLRVAGALGNLRPGGNGSSAAPPAPPERPPARPERPPARPARPARPRAAATPTPPPAAPPPPTADLPEPDPRIAERVESEPPPAEPPRPRARPRSAPPAGPAAPSNGAGSAAAEPLAGERATQDEGIAPVNLDSPPPAEPDHVSESPTLVRESAEPGVEDGVGATINVQEPWEGYGRMSAKDIVGRLSTSSAAELAAVQLYETANRKRQTVLKAAERELAKPNR